MKFPVIADSGANYHMFNNRTFFDTIYQAPGNILLGDGKTTISIQGSGVKCCISSNILTIPNVRYIPELSESIYSIFLHIKTPQHGLESSYDKGLYIQFPHFKTKAIICTDDICLDTVPEDSTSSDSFTSLTTTTLDTSSFCRNLTQFTSDLQKETLQLDNIFVIIMLLSRQSINLAWMFLPVFVMIQRLNNNLGLILHHDGFHQLIKITGIEY